VCRFYKMGSCWRYVRSVVFGSSLAFELVVYAWSIWVVDIRCLCFGRCVGLSYGFRICAGV